jgi:hypothetical protein
VSNSYIHETVDGTVALRLAQQYRKDPTGGVVVSVQQRTTLAGKSILLTPSQVQQLRDDLTAWLEAS